ncbi:hypothetical protein UlMin_020433 [Ulmus minor]
MPKVSALATHALFLNPCRKLLVRNDSNGSRTSLKFIWVYIGFSIEIDLEQRCVYNSFFFFFASIHVFKFHGELDTRVRAPSYFCELLRQFYPDLCFSLNVSFLLFYKYKLEIDTHIMWPTLSIENAMSKSTVVGGTRTYDCALAMLYLVEEVALEQAQLNKILVQAQRGLYLLLSRFILFYNSEHFSTFPNGFLVGGPADFFVNELSDQLQKLKVELVLLHYFSQIKVLQGMELRMTTSTRLKSCLYSFTSPSGPMYHTRAICHAAWDVLDTIFPVGQYPRHLISLFFRLLYPWYWPSSCWNFVISCIKAILFSIFELIISNWEKLSRPKRF